jgi:hypothetical protein
MFHSLPAVLIFGLLGFLICGCHDLQMRLFKACGVMLGYMSHLLLDEIYSIEWRGGFFRLKKSFGTAVKLYSKSMWGNVSTYSKLAFLVLVLTEDPMFREQIAKLKLDPQHPQNPAPKFADDDHDASDSGPLSAHKHDNHVTR